MTLIRSLLLLSAAAASALAAPPSEGLFGPIALSPIQDPFYVAPSQSALERAAPGTILRVRQIRPKDWKIDSTWQLLFKSQSQNGTALAALTTIFVPRFPYTDRVVLTARYTNSVSRRCAASARYSNGTIDDAKFLDQRWIVSSADFEGPNGANSAGRLQGRILIDAGRATQNFETLKLKADTKYVFHGYSGGSTAAAWAAQLYKSYGKGLNVVGAVWGGLPGNPRAVIEYVDGGLFAGLGALGAFGLGNAYKGVSDRLDQLLTPQGKELRQLSLGRCGTDAYQSLSNKRLLSGELNYAGNKLLDDPAIKPVVDSLVVGGVAAETPEIPVYAFHGYIDQIVPERTVSSAYANFCKNGANLLYSRIFLAEHFTAVNSASIVPFVRDRFDGKPWVSGCRYVDAIVPAQAIDLNSKGNRQQMGPNSITQQRAQQQQQQEQQELDRANKADPATQRAAIQQRINKLQEASV